MDLIFEIRELIQSLPVTLIFQHVKAHQDDMKLFHQLDCYAKINVALMKLIESLAYREGKPRNEECITALLHSRSLFAERRGKGRQRKSLEDYVLSMKAKYQVCLNSGHDTCVTFTEMLKDIERFGKTNYLWIN